MKTKTFITLCLILTCFSSIGQDRLQLLDSVFTSLHSQGRFNGNVMVAEQGIPIFTKSYGLADEEAKRSLNTQSIFELGSVSKQFTAMAIVLLQKQGKLSYDDLMSKYIPELSFYGDITVKNLVGHTSGLPDYMSLFDKKWDKSRIAVNDDIISELAKHQPELLFKPNQKYQYSNTGYALLGSIIEKVSGKSFGEFLEAYIFKPLEMTNTLVYRSRYQPRVIENYALGYELDSTDNKILLDTYGKSYYTYYLDGIVGDGMVNSNLADLLKWDRALYTDQLINDSDRKLIFSGMITKEGVKTNYGFGWILEDSTRYGKIVGHSGAWAGYLSNIERHLDNDKTVIILQNNLTRKSRIPTDDVRKIIYNEKLEIEKLQEVNLTATQLEVFAGVYASTDFPMKLRVFVKEGSLYGQSTAEGQGQFKLESYENNVFKNEDLEIRMAFDIEKHTMDFKVGSRVKSLFTKE